MKLKRNSSFFIIGNRLREGKDTTIDGFGTFSILNEAKGKSVVFTPSEGLLERLDRGPECPVCHTRDVTLINTSPTAYVHRPGELYKDYVCNDRECLHIWREEGKDVKYARPDLLPGDKGVPTVPTGD